MATDPNEFEFLLFLQEVDFKSFVEDFIMMFRI